MAEVDLPQIYLITPPEIDLDIFPRKLASVLDATDVACLRLSMSSGDEDLVARTADALREIAHARDVALIIEKHVQLVERLGLDGVHLMDGGRNLRKIRTELGEDAIIGAFCGVTRHDGITAAENGADYVSFGPVGVTALGDGSRAEPDLFDWWSEMVEIPVVAEGALTPNLVTMLSSATDFFAFGEEIWRHDDPAAALKELVKAMG